jgi:hypothetical protein
VVAWQIVAAPWRIKAEGGGGVADRGGGRRWRGGLERRAMTAWRTNQQRGGVATEAAPRGEKDDLTSGTHKQRMTD